MSIPKIIHYCWFGGKELPEDAKRYIESWKKYCPDYQIIEWNEKNFDLNSVPYVKEAYEEKISKLPKVGAIVKTEEGEGTVEGLETLKGVVKVKFKDGDGYYYKKYKAEDVKIIKNIEKEQIDEEEKEHMKELKEMEKLSKQEKADE